MAVREYDLIPAKLVREALFHIQLEFIAPQGFWEEEPEPPFVDPSQKYFWRRAVPKREEGWTWKDQWEADLHNALLKRGWPRGEEALYTYDDPQAVDGGIWNPDEGEEREEEYPPLIGFGVDIPGEWLEAHPVFLKDFEKLARNGVSIKVKGKREKFHLSYWRISAQYGELDGADWEHSIFLVRPARPKPEAFEGGPRDWFPE